MYIAFKWLSTMCGILWFGLCINDGCKNIHKHRNLTDPNLSRETYLLKVNHEDHNNKGHVEKHIGYVIFLMCFAVAFLVSLMNKKSRIILLLKIKAGLLYTLIEEYKYVFLYIASYLLDRGLTHARYLLISLCNSIRKRYKYAPTMTQYIVNIALIKRLRDLIEERRTLGTLLMTTMRDNRHIKMKYELENLANGRFALRMADSKKEMKINRTQCLNYQRLYLITNQENIFLKSRIERLIKEKEKVENNLLRIVNRVFLSKNYELKAYCTQFVVQTKENLLNADVEVEIQRFLNSSNTGIGANKNTEITTITTLDNDNANIKIIDVFNTDRGLDRFHGYGPKLRVLPGEYVWTVKDKNGIIQRLYECEYDNDNEDTIRRIREYSVYHDKEYFPASSSTLSDTQRFSFDINNLFQNRVYCLSNQRFLTGTNVFRRLLQNNQNMIHDTKTAILGRS